MIDSGNFAPNSGRFYGLQSVAPTEFTGPGSYPIMYYGNAAYDVDFSATSTAEMTINPDLPLMIEVNTASSPYRVQEGWIVEIYGGNQRASSNTVIEMKAQLDKVIQFQVGQTGRTFRAGQTVSLKLSVNTAINLIGTIKSFNAVIGQMVIDIVSTNGSGSYPEANFGTWLIEVNGMTGPSVDYMLAMVIGVNNPTSFGQPTNLTFQSYQAFGQGTYSQWTIGPQWERAHNFIRNPTHSAYFACVGPSTSLNPEGPDYSAAVFLPYGGETTRVNVVTTDTQLQKSGYEEITSKGATIVYEDEHDINRPYVGRTVTINMEMLTVTETTVITYDEFLNPTPVTTVVTSVSALNPSHTFAEQDFVPYNQPGVKYFAGNPAVYSGGQLVSAPTPSRYVRDDQASGSITYKGTEYEYLYQKFTFGDPPEEYILPVFIQNIGRGPQGKTQTSRPSPENFFSLT